MASNHTTNFELCQWQADDQVKRTDFNKDNAKIDAALAGRLGPFELIKEATAGQTCGSLRLDLTDVSWSQWSIILIISNPIRYTADYGSSSINAVNRAYTRRISGEITPAIGPNIFLLFPMRDVSRPPCILMFPGGQITLGEPGTSYADITNVQFSGNVSGTGFQVGSYIQVYGIH